MTPDFRYKRPDIEREAVPGADAPVTAPPYTICAITYISRPQNLPPFYNAALSLTQAGCRVDGYGTVRRLGYKRFEEIAPGFNFSRVPLHTRTFFLKLLAWMEDNIVLAGLQYILSYVEYNMRMLIRARKSQADLVEAHDLPALPCAWLIARLRGRPLVYHAHELWPELGAQVRFSGFWRALERLFVRRVDLIVVPEANRARIYREELGARKTPLVIANCPPFKPAGGGTMLGDLIASRGRRASCVVLYQGLITTDRCIEEIVGAAGHFDAGVSLAIIGNGVDAWSDPQSRLPADGSILYIPHVSYELLQNYTASAQIGLLFYRNTCRNNFFCAPNKLYEYMMMGLPVVTCNYPGLVDFVERQEIGLCVDPEDPHAIAGAVNRIAGDAALRNRMRENCLRLARSRWNWEQEFDRLREAYVALPAGLRVGPALNRTGAPKTA